LKAPNPYYIANLIVENGSEPEFTKLELVLQKILSDKLPTFSEEEILDYIEEYNKDIAAELFTKENDNFLDGIESTFDIKEEDGEYYVKFLNKPISEYLKKLQKLPAEDFELFCGNVLTKLGGNSDVIGGSDDGGIDFTATDLYIQNLPKATTRGSKVLVVGQAKRFIEGNHVKEKDIRQFVGASIKKIDDLKRTKSGNFGILHPVILAFWTTSDFHVNAKKLANDIGLWYLNGIALSQLALHLKIEL